MNDCREKHRSASGGQAPKPEPDRKRMEELFHAHTGDLRESYVRLRLAIKNSNVVVFTQDRDLRYTWICNPHPGLEAVSVLGKTDAELLPEEDAAILTRIKRRTLETGVKGREEVRTTIGGKAFFYELTVEPMRDAAGSIVGVSCASLDITERKRVEGELRRHREDLESLVRDRTLDLTESTRQFRLVVENMTDGIWLMDLAFNTTWISPSVSRLRGYTLEEIQALPMDAQLTPESAQRVAQAIAEELTPARLADPAVKISCLLELGFICKDGSVLWAECTYTVIRDADGNPQAILGAGHDITERKRAEAALRLFQESVENASDAVGMSTPEGKHFYQNKAFDDLFGTIDENPFDTAFVDHDMGREVFRTITAGGQWTGEVKLYTRDKRMLDFLLRAYANKDKDGRITALVGIFTDITEKRKLETNLRQAAKMDAVGRLAGGVAHDFNNMLAVILGYTELALECCAPEDPLHANLKQIEQAAVRSADLTRQLLAFARKQTVAPQVIDLNATVEGMLKLLRRLIGENVQLAWKPCRESAMVRMDPVQLDQVLANLCVNARDAIAAEGTITIETSTVFDESAGESSYIAPGEYVLLAVSDNGCGMDAETVSHIFEPFFTTKEQGKGTGLGLATLYGVIKQNNGYINVHSEPQLGTTFTIYLPRFVADGATAAAEEAEVPTHARGKETVLLVEDEPVILQMATRMIRQLGYEVLAAGTPGEALECAKQYAGQIDLLITDVVMPGMNGRDLADSLLLHRPGLKRLYMSGYTADVIAEHGVLDEGVHFIQKPFTIKVLAEKLRGALGGARTTES